MGRASFTAATRRQLLVAFEADGVLIVCPERGAIYRVRFLGARHQPQPAAPDFDNDLIVVAAMGERSSGGYRIAIDDADIDTGNARISVTEHSPGDGCVVTATAPVAVVMVPRFSGDTSFVERTRVVDCE